MNSSLTQSCGLLDKLKLIAKLKSVPFCYGCYSEASSGRCLRCGSDDLMRLVRGSGCEYGDDWIIEEILQECESVDTSEAFEDFVNECYPDNVKIGWIEVSVSTAIKDIDPISWENAKNEWLDSQVEDEIFVTFDNGSTYFVFRSLNDKLDEIMQNLEDTKATAV